MFLLTLDVSIETMFVYKRNGTKEPVNFDQVLHRIEEMTRRPFPLEGIDCAELAKKVIGRLTSGMHTQDIDLFTAELSAESFLVNPNYQTLGARILIDNHHKNTPDSFSAKVNLFQTRRDENGDISPLLMDELVEFIETNAAAIDAYIDYERDYLLDFFGFATLYDQFYLLRINDKPIERPQDLFMRVALFIHMDSLEDAFETYDFLSKKRLMHASPTLFNAGLTKPGCISCFLAATDDSREGIKRVTNECVDASAACGGIAFSASKWRSKGSLIKSSGGHSNGVVPFIRMAQEGVNAFNQQSRRRGSLAVYLDMHHPDLFEFLDMRRSGGDETTRCHNVFIGLWVPDLFMKRVESGGVWSFFDPHKHPILLETFGEEYERHYERLEEAGAAKYQRPARDVWREIYTVKLDSGIPYMLAKDTINRTSNHSNLGLIRNSNLCTEIVEYNVNDDAAVDQAETACCTLASISLPAFVDKAARSFDYESLAKTVDIAVKNLNKIIDRSFYPSAAAARGSKNHRPIGTGVQGLADVYHMLKIAFDSDEARELNKRIFETIYYSALSTSARLARDIKRKTGQSGAYPTFYINGGAPLSRGIFNFELHGLTTADLLQGYDWETLREFILKYGVRNSLMVALMPTASTSQMLGNTECFEPIQANIYTRRVMSGEYYIINRHMYEELKEMGAWNNEVIEALKVSQGSVQGIKQLPQSFRDRYKTAWELRQKVLVDQAADRQPFVDQSQSMNFYFDNFNQEKFTASHFAAWKAGLKTLCYYVRQRPPVRPVQVTLSKEYKENERAAPKLEATAAPECQVCGT